MADDKAPPSYPVNAAHLMRTAQLAQISLSQMADTKASILMGATFAVPKGRDVGGTFKNIPVCKSNTQVGCVISFASFRSTIPPPANTLFGRAPSADQVAICTNPSGIGPKNQCSIGWPLAAIATVVLPW